MSELDLIRQLGDLLGRPLEEIAEDRFEQHIQAKFTKDWTNPDLIRRDSYSLSQDGIVSGLFLQPVTSQILFGFPFEKFSHVKHLHLNRVNLPNFSFTSKLKNLSSLDLGNNNISDVLFLKELKNLTSLYLGSNEITDISFLRELEWLASLDLSFNNISNVSFLRGVKGLTSLNLSGTNIIEASFLKEQKGLKLLHISNSNITNLSFLSNLEGITSLDLSFNNIANVSFLGELKGIEELYLTFNKINDFSSLKKLKKLKSLNIADTDIADFSFLRELKELKSLDLGGNSIVDISFLEALKFLAQVNLGRNNITNISVLADFKALSSLDLSFNSIVDASFLRDLKRLTWLSLNRNRITDISFLSEIKKLKHLYLGENQIVDFNPLKNLREIESLNLGGSSISDFSFLKEMKEISWLFLEDNRIGDFSFLKDLKGLTSISLSNTGTSKIPRWLAESRMAVHVDVDYAASCIDLHNNPIEEPPLEIARQGNAAILSYYTQLAAQGQDYLYEAKMLIVGEGEAGKTTLAHKILDPNCPLPHIDDRTRGISIQSHIFSCRKRDGSGRSEAPTFHLNIWDFGGQEIYHATHRFFLSKRSLYVLVADNRKDDTDFNYWLNIIELFAGKSPLIIVLNEKGDVQRSLNRADLLSRYPDSVKEIVAVNFKTREEPDAAKAQQRLRDIHTLIGHIEHCAQNLSHIGEAVPARWVDVRQAIEDDQRNYIYRDQFDELCQSHGITTSQDIDTLLGYFHDLGILLHFAENPLLRDRVILKPTWATNAVYRIFDNDTIKAKAGRFSRQDCANIWNDPQYRHTHDILIELMKNFRLVYEIENTGELVAPQLLPQDTPAYDWNEAHNSHMQFRYDAFMPRGIFWQFAVTMYRYIHNHDWVWRSGMVIRRGNTWAEVKEDLNLRRISLRFYGPSIAEFRAVIVDELDNISQSYHQLHYDKMIPCQCGVCKDISSPHFFKYSRLKERQESGKKPTIECEISEEDVSLRLLLEGFEVQQILATLPDKKGGEPTPPPLPQAGSAPAPQSQPTMRTIKIFLASSSELKADREQFEIFINRKNKEYIKDGIFLELVIWEDFLDAMSQTRLQDEYNKAITDCNIFVSLFHSKVGQYTREEFLKALDTFKANGRPLIYTYFKDLEIKFSTTDRKSINSLFDFQEELSNKGHFYTPYSNIEDLKYKFGEQLIKLLPQWRQRESHP